MKIQITILILLLFIIDSLDAQDFWATTSFQSNGSIKKIVINRVGDVFVVNTQGLYRSTDYGDTWIHLTAQGPYINDIKINFENVIYLSYDSGIYCSTDNGINWLDISPEPVEITAIGFNSQNHLFVGGGNPDHNLIYYSSDNGISWEQRGLLSIWSTINMIEINALDNIYVIRNGPPETGLSISTNSGLDWLRVDFLNYNSISFDSLNNILVGRDDGVFYSSNHGYSWIGVSNGLPNNYIYSTQINSLGHYFVSTGLGVFKSTDSGILWSEINSGLLNGDILKLAIDLNGFLFAGSSDGKIYKSKYTTTDINVEGTDIPVSFYLSQNYPNPFNPTTKISWKSPISSLQTLKVYDVLGNEISTLINEFRKAGSYEIDFNAGNLPSGVYFYQLKLDDNILTKKMLLIK